MDELSELRVKTRAMDEAPVGILITDPEQDDNPIIYANERFQSLTGYREAEILGRNCRFLQGEGTDPEPVARMRAAIDARESVSVELLNYRKDGSEFWNHVTIAPITDDTGTVTHFVGFQEDVTQRKEREAEIRETNARLEEFASFVSHDLRSPLNVAQGRVDLARQDRDTEDLAAAAAALERCETLIDDLLTLAREGDDVSETEPVDVGELAQRCWRTIESNGAELVVEASVVVEADRGRLRQLLENLLGNAVAHAGSGVTVTVGDLDDGGGFFVADDGPGIPGDVRDRVFDAGFTTSPDGTGVGLNIVRTIAEAHGWDVNVRESRDGGARFDITTRPRPEFDPDESGA